jgi:hypothetical protein
MKNDITTHVLTVIIAIVLKKVNGKATRISISTQIKRVWHLVSIYRYNICYQPLDRV